MGQRLDRVRDNNNQFWQTARQLHLDGLLESVYGSGPKKEPVKQWLHGCGLKRVLIRPMNVKQVRIGGFTVGIVGLDDILDEVRILGETDEVKLKDLIFEKVKALIQKSG